MVYHLRSTGRRVARGHGPARPSGLPIVPFHRMGAPCAREVCVDRDRKTKLGL
jgi:hypothetical protein